MAPLLKSDAREMIAALHKPETIEKYVLFWLKTVLFLHLRKKENNPYHHHLGQCRIGSSHIAWHNPDSH